MTVTVFLNRELAKDKLDLCALCFDVRHSGVVGQNGTQPAERYQYGTAQQRYKRQLQNVQRKLRV